MSEDLSTSGQADPWGGLMSKSAIAHAWTAPPMPDPLVVRPGAGKDVRRLQVVAGAGYGKTTVLTWIIHGRHDRPALNAVTALA